MDPRTASEFLLEVEEEQEQQEEAQAVLDELEENFQWEELDVDNS